MKIRMKLKHFLGKRRTTLQKICERNSIRSRAELDSFLDGLGVEPTSDSQASGLFRLRPKQSRRQEKKPVETKPATKSLS